MNELRIFSNEEFGNVRTVEIDGEPWLVGKDVAETLGYERPTKAVVDHTDEEDRKMLDGETQSQFGIELGQRGGWLVNESGFISLVLSSKMPKAKEYKRWVTSEVLPTIRKTGMYMTGDALAYALANPKNALELLANYVRQQEVIKEQGDKIKIMEPKAIYYDDLCDKDDGLNLSETAKILGIGPHKFTALLVEHGYLFRNSRGTLLPYEDRNVGLFDVKNRKSDYSGWSGSQTFVTLKGREVLNKLLKKWASKTEGKDE